MKKYRLITDGDTHWFVIPADKEDEWSTFCEAAEKYWDDIPFDYEEAPKQPEWAIALGGGPSRVVFGEYEIN